MISCTKTGLKFKKKNKSTSFVITTPLSAGSRYTCALNSLGTLKCWGRNNQKQLGLPDTNTDYISPTEVMKGARFSSISAGYYLTCGIVYPQKLYCWGSGDIGNGTDESNSPPVAVNPEESYIDVSVGFYMACAITHKNQLKCWGTNNDNQLGNGSANHENRPVHIDVNEKYVKVSSGKYFACALTTSNKIKCWGKVLGDVSYNTTPQLISNESFKTLSSGVDHACAVTIDDELKCWGENTYYQLGAGSNEYVIYMSPTLIDSHNKYKTVTSAKQHTCAITTNNELKCWGWNSQGILGDGTEVERYEPTTIDSGVSYIYASALDNHTCALTTQYQLKCWGVNSSGELGYTPEDYMEMRSPHLVEF